MCLGKLLGDAVLLESILPGSDLATVWGQWASMRVDVHYKNLSQLPKVNFASEE